MLPDLSDAFAEFARAPELLARRPPKPAFCTDTTMIGGEPVPVRERTIARKPFRR